MNSMEDAVFWYKAYLASGYDLSNKEILNFASALEGIGNYQQASKWYQDYLKTHPANADIQKRVWQLQNIGYLLEDSIYFKVSPVSVNTAFDELGPYIYNDTLIFLSNRPKVSVIHRKDGSSEKSYFQWLKPIFDQFMAELPANH